MKFKWCVLLVIAALFVGSAGCGQQSASSGSNTTSDLAEALAFAPTNLKSFAFTDWSLIKIYEGVQNVISSSSDQDRGRFLSSIAIRQAPASSFGISNLLTHEAFDTWSFDTTDYSWEATFNGMGNLGPAAYVVKLRDNFDLTPLIAHFRDRKFSSSSYRGSTIYSHTQSVLDDWFGPFADGIGNTAILANEKTLVFSNSLNVLHTVLDVHSGATASLANDSAIHDFVLRLGVLFSVDMIPSTTVCTILGSLPVKQQAVLQSDLSGSKKIHAYTWLGVGYRYDQRHLAGLIGLHFSNSADASADLETRRKLAANGTSLVSEHPYSSDVFTVDGAVAQKANLVLQVSPISGEPVHLFDSVSYYDFAYAACPD